MTYIFWLSVIQIIWIDVLLSGDNAVVIALACRALPPRQRTIGIAIGTTAAVGLRIAVATVISFLLAVPFLKVIGGLLLLYIGLKVIQGEDAGTQAGRHSERLIVAIGLIVMADITMSLDNVVAIAAAARGNDLVFVIGLLVSMPLMIVGASLITALITRFPIIVWLGGGLLGWIAGNMILSDPYVLWVTPDDVETAAHYAASAVGAIGVATAAYLTIRYRTADSPA